jgi:hypothetical protein
MTGVTNCQGLILDPDLAYSIWHTFASSITVQNTNIDATFNPYSSSGYGYAWWLTYQFSCQSGPISLSDDYSSGPSANPSQDLVWPGPSSSPTCGARHSRGVVSWPDLQIKGSISIGLPPGGDFVPASAVGLGYRSPGYRR